MAKKESTFLGMLLTLLLVTLIASAALGFVFKFTEPAIKEAEALKLSLAIKRVVPEYNNLPGEEFVRVPANDRGDSLTFYIAKMDNDTVGYAVETFSKKGFAGLINLLVGLKPDGTINNIAVLKHKETPGLGTKMLKSQNKWSYQFNDKNPAEYKLKVVKDGGNVDAITASTITSRAYCDAVQRAYTIMIKEFKVKEGGQK